METPIPLPIPYSHTSDEVEEADFRQVANPGNFLMLPADCSRGDVIETISKTIPTNDFGLPLYFIRSDLLDCALCASNGYVDQTDSDNAGELLTYQDGYPVMKSGAPFWTQMAHEPHTAYLLFKRFLDLNETEGVRLIHTLAHQEGLDLTQVQEQYKEFYWSSRARAYDLFIIAADAKRREVRIRKTEDVHFSQAESLLGKVLGRFKDEPDLINQLSPKELFDIFEQLVKIQRLSLGLTGQNASSTNKELQSPGASVEVVLRQLTKNIGLGDQTAESLQGRLAVLMSDQNTAMQVQELIVKATSNGVNTQ